MARNLVPFARWAYYPVSCTRAMHLSYHDPIQHIYYDLMPGHERNETKGRGLIASVWGYGRPARETIYTWAWCCRTPAPHRVLADLCPTADIKLVHRFDRVSGLSTSGQARSMSLFENRLDSLEITI